MTLAHSDVTAIMSYSFNTTLFGTPPHEKGGCGCTGLQILGAGPLDDQSAKEILEESNAASVLPSHYLANARVIDTRGLNNADPEKAKATVEDALEEIRKLAISKGDPALPQHDHERTLVALGKAMWMNLRIANYAIVEDLFKLSEASGIQMNDIVYDARLSAMACQDVNQALQYFHHLTESNVVSPYSLTIMVDSMVKHNQLFRAVELMNEWEKTKRPIPQPAFTSVIAGFHQARQPAKAWELFNRMQFHYTTPDEVTYGLMMAVCARTDEIERALALFDRMRASRLMPTTATCNMLLLAMSRRVEYAREAWRFYEQCLLAGFTPDDRTFGGLMACARRTKDWLGFGQRVWDAASSQHLITNYTIAQALWTISVEQVQVRKSLKEQVDFVLPAEQVEGMLGDTEVMNGYLATCFPYRPDIGLDLFRRIKSKDGMTFRLALSYTMEDQSSRPESSDAQTHQLDRDCGISERVFSPEAVARRAKGAEIWQEWDSWYSKLRQECDAHIEKIRADDPRCQVDAVSNAFFSKHTMTQSVLYKLVSIVCNGVAADHPTKAVVLLLKYCQEYGLKIRPQDFAKLSHFVKLAEDLRLAKQWQIILETYKQPDSPLEKSLRQLRRKWSRVNK